jgi:hypothetical protein
VLLLAAVSACDPADLEPTEEMSEALAWKEQQELKPSDGAEFDFFGANVVVDGPNALISSHFDGSNPSQVGACYVFSRSDSTWTEQQKLIPSDPTQVKHFGSSLALEADSALIGASGDASARGAVYAFTRVGTTWNETQKIVASDGQAGESYGFAVDLDGDRAVVGAPGDSDQGLFSGGAYLLARSAGVWSLEKKLLPSDGAGHRWFGQSVGVDGDTIVVGAPADPDTDPALAGAAYAFVRDAGGWVEHPLAISDGFVDDQFGAVVAIFGDTIVVGAPGAWQGVTSPGSVYVFVRAPSGGFSLQAKLVSSTPQIGDRFGLAVAAGIDRLLIGEPYHDTPFEDSGTAYVFARSGGQWSVAEKLTPNDASALDEFGASASLSGTTAVIGTLLPNDGVAYAFTLIGATCSADSECGTGACADGFCCNARCDQSCMDCNLAGSEGECGPVPAGQTDELCDGVCDGTGLCKRRNGLTCAEAGDCDSGFCVDGVCCNSACSGVCDSCALAGLEGTCSPKNCSPFICDANGDCLTGCTSTADCANGFACNASGQCVAAPASSAQSSEDGCGCRMPARAGATPNLLWLLLALLASRRRAR